MTESGRAMAETLINVREAAGSKLDDDSLPNNGTDIVADILPCEPVTTILENSDPPVETIKYPASNSFATNSKFDVERPSLHTLGDKISQSKDNIFPDEPSWLDGLLHGEMEIISETETENESRKDNSESKANKNFLYCYISDTGNECNDQNDAEVDIDKTVCYLVCCRLGKLRIHRFYDIAMPPHCSQ